MGIVVVPATQTGPDIVAYIVKQSADPGVSGNPDGLEVLSLTGAGAFTTDASATTASTDGTATPTYVAVTPDNAHVYVSYGGADKYAVFDNTQASAPPLPGSAFALKTASASPQGIAVPVVSAVPTTVNFLVFIAQSATNNLGVIDDQTAPAEDSGSPLTLVGTAPLGIATTPAPQ
jgi:DNA-binding beta-propeller fold protein YncE